MASIGGHRWTIFANRRDTMDVLGRIVADTRRPQLAAIQVATRTRPTERRATIGVFVTYGPLRWGTRQWESKQRRPHEWNSVGRRSSEEIDVLGIWTTNMASLINEDIREHYERRTVEWQRRMMRMLQTDVPALNDTSCGQLMPFPEDTGGGANNGSHDDLLFGRDVWTPLIISGSSGK
jgi:hypothetical protein